MLGTSQPATHLSAPPTHFSSSMGMQCPVWVLLGALRAEDWENWDSEPLLSESRQMAFKGGEQDTSKLRGCLFFQKHRSVL